MSKNRGGLMERDNWIQYQRGVSVEIQAFVLYYAWMWVVASAMNSSL